MPEGTRYFIEYIRTISHAEKSVKRGQREDQLKSGLFHPDEREPPHSVILICRTVKREEHLRTNKRRGEGINKNRKNFFL